ncbi:hypothetical protein LINPERHAP1_LOCUS22237, partial [Linum perenne]
HPLRPSSSSPTALLRRPLPRPDLLATSPHRAPPSSPSRSRPTHQTRQQQRTRVETRTSHSHSFSLRFLEFNSIPGWENQKGKELLLLLPPHLRRRKMRGTARRDTLQVASPPDNIPSI